MKTLVEPTKLEVSPVEATDQQRWRLELEGARLQAARTAIGRAAEPTSAVIGRRQPVRPFLRIPLLQLDWPGEGDIRDSLKYS